jgi:ribosomal protein L11 methyltransferase
LIRLDPGLAFGTGQHPTTQMCLELLSERASTLAGKTLLDVGCGSGVLSIAACKMGAQATASDFDPHCTEATRENAAMNDVQFSVVEAAGLDWCQETFDVVIANLMSDLLITLAPALARVAKEQSTLIVSGISSPRADEVEGALHQAGFSIHEKRERNGELRGNVQERWTAFVFGVR